MTSDAQALKRRRFPFYSRIAERAWLLSCLICLLFSLARGEAPPAYTMRGYDPRIQKGIDLIYELRFAEADQYFERIIQDDPDNPVGYFFRAMVAWWRVLVDLEDREHDEAFYERIEECIRVCDRRLKKDPMDFDAVLFKGGAVGFRGRLRGDRGQYLKAASDGLKCLPLLKKSRRMDPANKDILFGQGIYNYFAEVMPKRIPVIRPIMLFLPKGDREKGLEQLEEVAREGKYARSEAAYFLARIYRVFEEDQLAALRHLETLHQRYPHNALFHRFLARTLAELGRWKEAVPLYEEYLRRNEEKCTGYHVHGRLEALYYIGEHAFFQRRLARAKERFTEVDSLGRTSDRETDQAYATLAELMLGMTCDLQGKRDRAVAWYKRVRKRKKQGNSRKLAKKYLREPYSGTR